MLDKSYVRWCLNSFISSLNGSGSAFSKCLQLVRLATSVVTDLFFNFIGRLYRSKKEGKDQELIQSSTTPDPGYQWESD